MSAALKTANTPVPNRRVLVIDDEPEIANGIKAYLCPPQATLSSSRSSRSLSNSLNVDVSSLPAVGRDFEVTVVHSPKDAMAAVELSLIENRPFAIGFFDVVLGADIDGIQLVKKIFEIDPHLFAVFVTAYHDRSVDSISQYLGAERAERWDYINKPFSEGEILQKARNAASLWDLQRLKLWQEERISEANQLLLKNERQNAVAAVGRSVAHEFGNLLTHIVGNAELALKKTDPEFTRRSMEIILKAADTAGTILKRFRRMDDDGPVQADFSLFSVDVPVRDALELMAFHFRKAQIKVNQHAFNPRNIRGNHHSLVQVLVNLFINSTHAMPNGGEIHIRTVDDEDRDFVTICIRDTGSGIPEDIIHRVTEPMFSTKGRDGSGLGLAIVKEIIEMEHQGDFLLSNHPLGGLEVTIRLPVKEDT